MPLIELLRPEQRAWLRRSTRASFVRAGTQSSGGAASAEVLDQIACVAAAVSSGRSALSSCAPSSPGMSAKAGVSVVRSPTAGRSVCRRGHQQPQRMVPPARGRQARLDDHGGFDRRRRSATPAVRPGLACSELPTDSPARRTHNRSLPGKAAGRRDAPRTRAGGSTPIGRRTGTES